MKSVLRLSALWEYLKGALWVLPTLFVIVAIVAASALAAVDLAPDSGWQSWVFSGSASSARGVLSVVAGAMITVTALTFSMTVVALQMASSQYSPRVLRGFLTDRGNQVVLSLFLATFAYCVAVIRVTRGEGALGGAALPQVAITMGFILLLAAMGAVVYFLHHLTQQLRIETIMRDIVAETLHTIDRLHPADDKPSPARTPLSGQRQRVAALRSGYLQAVDVKGLVRAAATHDLTVQLRVAVGAHITEGTTLAWAYTQQPDLDARGLRHLVHDHLHIGRERTMQQDVEFGVRQLVDIAGKALSPGINDPTTAVEAIARLSQLLCRLVDCQLGELVRTDDDGQLRAIIPRPTFAEYLALACAQPRQYGQDDPVVLQALLAMLADVAELAPSEQHRQAIRSELERTVEMAAAKLDATDLAAVQTRAAEVQTTLLSGRPAP